MGVNPWKCAAQLFLEKLGLFSDDTQTMRMFMGNYMEAHIATLWQYWEGSEESVIRNYQAGRRVRECRERGESIRLKKYPFLVGNIDREIMGRQRGVLECKQINGYYAQQWAIEIPPAYLYQVQQYLLLTGHRFAEIALLKDGNSLSVMRFEANAEMQSLIIERAGEFWQRIEAAHPLAAEYLKEEAQHSPDRRRLSGLMEAISRHEPEVEGTPAYEAFLRQRYRQAAGERIGTHTQLTTALQYLSHGQAIKDAKSQQRECKNALLRGLGDSDTLDFGDAGRVTWKVNEKGVRTLRVSVRTD